MKKAVFILLIFCSFLVVWGCNKNKTKCVPQKEATSDSSMRSNDDTLSLMIEHEVDDVDYGVIIKRATRPFIASDTNILKTMILYQMENVLIVAYWRT